MSQIKFLHKNVKSTLSGKDGAFLELKKSFAFLNYGLSEALYFTCTVEKSIIDKV